MIKIHHDVPAADLTTLAVGGPIKTVVEVSTEADLLDALSDYEEAICIGGGSNLLVSDTGFDGVVIRSYVNNSFKFNASDDGIIQVDAMVNWDSLVIAAIEQGLQGLESTSGVPGSFGGAIVQNLGAYGQEVCDVVQSVNVWNSQTRQTATLSKDDCQFSYRNSRFKHDASREFVITSANIQLTPAHTAMPRYGDVSELLAQRFERPGPYDLMAIREAVLDVRRSKGMLLGASLPSAGSFFTNPIIDSAKANELTALGFKTFTRADGNILVSAAALMQRCGYHKDFRMNQAGLSEFHVLALVNIGGAKAKDIIELANRIRHDVHERFGVTLIPEPVALGFDSNPF